MWDFTFFLHSVVFGVSLAADAFSVSLANGLNEQKMKKSKMLTVAGIFAFFQALMPFIGWFLIRTLVKQFEMLNKFVPWVALALLVAIGVKMLVDGIKNKEEECGKCVGLLGLFVQGIATSIDALSAGLGMSEYELIQAFVSVCIIGALTFVICLAGILIGKKFGTRLSGKATILGGVILIVIGVRILLTSMF